MSEREWDVGATHFWKLSGQKFYDLQGCKWHKSDDQARFPLSLGRFFCFGENASLKLQWTSIFYVLIATCLETIELLRTLLSHGSASSRTRIDLDTLGQNFVICRWGSENMDFCLNSKDLASSWWFATFGVGSEGVSFSLIELVGIHLLLRQERKGVVCEVKAGCGALSIAVSRRKQELVWLRRSFLFKGLFLS